MAKWIIVYIRGSKKDEGRPKSKSIALWLSNDNAHDKVQLGGWRDMCHETKKIGNKK